MPPSTPDLLDAFLRPDNPGHLTIGGEATRSTGPGVDFGSRGRRVSAGENRRRDRFIRARGRVQVTRPTTGTRGVS